ncbi:HNH endonuclease signature motif containing protein [Microbacterium sp. ZKA21]|uniref:HNH endonuclease signature motif containing protein n=1 Tax=Microbacterium sp. ZKA21 TaxID=3381694 RepID=UPI003D235327
MNFFTEIDARVATLRSLLGEDAAAADLPTTLRSLSDDELVDAMRASAALTRCIEKVAALGAGIAAARSTRESGHSGLAQSRGHRNPVGLLQEVTGGTRTDAAQRIRVGSALLEADAGADAAVDQDADAACDAGVDQVDPSTDARPLGAWHAPADAALLAGRISAAQHDAILRGLGEPRAASSTDADAHDAWLIAAEQLVDEAAHRTVEELGSSARTLRDILDPEGAERRFQQRFDARSFRLWTDRDGIHHGSTTYDDEGFALVRSINDAALRPRLGGPRFVDATEKDAAQALVDDPRTNDQLAYDLMIDLVSAGARAEAVTVFGVKQAGVRLVQKVSPTGERGAVLTEDGLIALPRAAADQRLCDTGALVITVDSCGNPLQIGREQRLFTPKQRVTLAIRDGGCRWRNCDRPASYCEAHHIDEWSGGGRTDVERGILLCRFHHMQLHHGGWWVTRDGTGDFVLHHPGGASFILPQRIALRYAFADLDPPPRRFTPAA